MSSGVAVIGTGMVKVGKSDVPSWDLFARAAVEAMHEADVGPSDIEAFYLGNVYSDFTEHQTNIAPKVLSSIGIYTGIPTIKIETACASGSVAFRQGLLTILSGASDLLLVGGTERLRAVDGNQAQEAMSSTMDRAEDYVGLTFAGYFGMVAKDYMAKYNIEDKKLQELLAGISVKNHYHGKQNPLAQFCKEITKEEVLNSPVVADPIKLMDCCPFSDGAAAVILASEKFVRDRKISSPIWVVGSGQASGPFPITEKEDLSFNPAIEKAARMAYSQAGLTPKDIDVAEVHDCVNIHEVVNLEGVGLVPEGKGIYAAEEELTYAYGKIPVNLSGGLKSRGHPVGATGAYQICEIVRQLRGDFQGIQLKEPKIGLTVNLGGTGSTVTVHIFKR